MGEVLDVERYVPPVLVYDAAAAAAASSSLLADEIESVPEPDALRDAYVAAEPHFAHAHAAACALALLFGGGLPPP